MSAHNDTAFLRMFLMILGALVAFTVIIVIAANMIGGEIADLQANDPMRRAAVAERIKPFGQVKVGGAAGEDKVAAVPRGGEEVYTAVCLACHSTGAAGAPKVGDKPAWEPRVGQGLDGLVQAAIAGKGGMPPRGGNPSTTDEEIRAAVVYMLDETSLSAAEAAGGSEPAEMVATLGRTVSDMGDKAVDMASAVTGAVAGAAATISESAGGGADIDLEKGQQVYQGACLACHSIGVAGAPKLGDTADWEPRISQGSETLLGHAINGFQGNKGVMPAKGGRMDLSDAEVAAAVAYMVSQSR